MADENVLRLAKYFHSIKHNINSNSSVYFLNSSELHLLKEHVVPVPAHLKFSHSGLAHVIFDAVVEEWETLLVILGTSYADSPFFVQTISLDILAIDRSIMLNSVIKKICTVEPLRTNGIASRSNSYDFCNTHDNVAKQSYAAESTVGISYPHSETSHVHSNSGSLFPVISNSAIHPGEAYVVVRITRNKRVLRIILSLT